MRTNDHPVTIVVDLERVLLIWPRDKVFQLVRADRVETVPIESVVAYISKVTTDPA